MADIIREAKDMKEVEEQLETYIKENSAKFRQWYGFEYEDEREAEEAPYQEQYSTSLQPMIERQKEEAEALARQIRPQMPYNNIIENTGKILYENLPPYPFGYSLGMLVQAKRDMDKANLINSDNYYHRLGMAQIGQEANNIPGLYPAGKFWGYAKEGLDITKKVLEGQPFLEILKDSQKDLNNNDESLNWGLNNPNASVRKWLGGLDINTNTWKKQNE